MSEQTAIIVPDDRQKTPARLSDTAQGDSMLAVIERLARDPNADVDKLEKMLAVKERWEANEAKKAFYAARAEFKNADIHITKDKDNLHFKSKYASIDSLTNTVNPVLSKHGLSATWSFPTPEAAEVWVTCTLSHRDGHSESVTFCAPPDTSGSKNPVQARLSTVTYLRKTTYESVTGVAASDQFDDDGNAAGQQIERITPQQAADIRALLEETKSQETKFLAWLKVDKIEDIRASEYGRAVGALERKK